jgi:hypothetical protein
MRRYAGSKHSHQMNKTSNTLNLSPWNVTELHSFQNLTCAKHTTSLNLVLDHEISQLFALTLDSFTIND